MGRQVQGQVNIKEIARKQKKAAFIPLVSPIGINPKAQCY